MFKTIITATLLGVIPVFVSAGYSASDYSPDYVPYNFNSAVDRQNCKDELAEFNADYNAIAKGYNESLVDVILISGVAWSLDNADNLFKAIQLYYSTEFKYCIQDDDRRIRVEAEEAEFKRAVEECDFDYFENMMTDKERMDTYDERMACKEELGAEAKIIEKTETEHVPVPVYVPPSITPVVSPEPVIYQVSEKPTQVTPVTSIQDSNTISSNEIENEQTTTSTATTTIELTEEELNQLIEQRVNEAMEQTQPEKQSIFKRVVNFFFGWLR